MKLILIFFAISLIANSQTLKEKLQRAGYEVKDKKSEKLRIFYERADGSVYEKVRGQDKFIEIIKSKDPNPFIQERLVSGKVTFEYTDLEGNTLGTSDLNNWYIISDNKNTTSVIEADIYTKVKPNPIEGNSVIEFTLKESSVVRIYLSDLAGKENKNIHSKFYYKGNYEFNVSLNDYPDGVYLLTLQVNEKSKTIKLIKSKGE